MILIQFCAIRSWVLGGVLRFGDNDVGEVVGVRVGLGDSESLF